MEHLIETIKKQIKDNDEAIAILKKHKDEENGIKWSCFDVAIMNIEIQNNSWKNVLKIAEMEKCIENC